MAIKDALRIRLAWSAHAAAICIAPKSPPQLVIVVAAIYDVRSYRIPAPLPY
jgi:hypothetical protein